MGSTTGARTFPSPAWGVPVLCRVVLSLGNVQGSAVVLGGSCGFGGSVSPQKAGKCVWGPAVISGGCSLLWGWCFMSHITGEVGSGLIPSSALLPAVGEPRIAPGWDPALLCLAGHTALPLSLWHTWVVCGSCSSQEGTVPPPGLLQGLPAASQGAISGNEEKLPGLRIPWCLLCSFCLCAVLGFQQICLESVLWLRCSSLANQPNFFFILSHF